MIFLSTLFFIYLIHRPLLKFRYSFQIYQPNQEVVSTLSAYVRVLLRELLSLVFEIINELMISFIWQIFILSEVTLKLASFSLLLCIGEIFMFCFELFLSFFCLLSLNLAIYLYLYNFVQNYFQNLF